MTVGRDERGSALLGVMMFTAVAALIIATLIGRVVLEYRAVEDSLAQTRAYWAAEGFNAYALSRTMSAPLCSGANCSRANLSGSIGSFVNEIKDLQSWYYLDVSPSYMIQLNSTVCQDNFAPSGAVDEFVIKTAFSGNAGGAPAAPPCPAPPAAGQAPAPCAAVPAPPPTTIGALQGLASMRPVELHFCLAGPGVTTCGAGPTGAGSTQPQLITALHRPAC